MRFECIVKNYTDAYYAQSQSGIGQIFVVFLDFGIKLILWDDFPKPVAESCEDAVPD